MYLAFILSKQTVLTTNLCVWEPVAQCPRKIFGRQAIAMVWDYAEGNLFSDSSGAWSVTAGGILGAKNRVFEIIAGTKTGVAEQVDAIHVDSNDKAIISTDPPYYDNIGYADLSDFYYVWLRKTLPHVYPKLFGTVGTPKAEELVATPHRHGSKRAAEKFFLDGIGSALQQLQKNLLVAFPASIYYAFKQAEAKNAEVVITGWETFLDALIGHGLQIYATWPMRTENTGGLKLGMNALASSIILACEPRPADAPVGTRGEFRRRLQSEFPKALALLQASNIAPVDLAQASIGPGMRIFTEYSRVEKSDGCAMTVREALAMINQTLDEVLSQQEGDFDSDTRWAITWLDQYGFSESDFGDAETLSKAKGNSPDGLVQAGIVDSGRGKVRLLHPDELDPDWDPTTDRRSTVWEMTHHLIRVLETEGEQSCADLMRGFGANAESARELCYRLYSLSDKHKRAADAQLYNKLIQSWPEIRDLATKTERAEQAGLGLEQ